MNSFPDATATVPFRSSRGAPAPASPDPVRPGCPVPPPPEGVCTGAMGGAPPGARAPAPASTFFRGLMIIASSFQHLIERM